MESTKFAHGVEESVLPKVSVLPRRHAQMGWEYRIPSLPIPWPKMSPQSHCLLMLCIERLPTVAEERIKLRCGKCLNI